MVAQLGNLDFVSKNDKEGKQSDLREFRVIMHLPYSRLLKRHKLVLDDKYFVKTTRTVTVVATFSEELIYNLASMA